MKKINLLIIVVLAGLVGFVSSCKKDPIDFASPTVAFTLGDQEVDSNSVVTIVGTVYAPAELDKIQYFMDDASYGTDVTSFDTDTTHVFTVTIAADLVVETFTFEVQATDKDGKIGKKTATITVKVAPVGTLMEYTVTLGDQNDNEGSFIDLNTSNIYFHSDGSAETNQAVVDLVYYWGNTGNASMYSPQGAVDVNILSFGNLEDWTTRATTALKLDNTADYANATYESVETGIGSTTDQAVTQIAENDLIYFKLDDGKCGIIDVGTIVPGKGDIKEVTFSYKIQVDPVTK